MLCVYLKNYLSIRSEMRIVAQLLLAVPLKRAKAGKARNGRHLAALRGPLKWPVHRAQIRFRQANMPRTQAKPTNRINGDCGPPPPLQLVTEKFILGSSVVCSIRFITDLTLNWQFTCHFFWSTAAPLAAGTMISFVSH